MQELDFVQIDRHLVALAVEALESAKRSGKKIVTAESCTGGLIATVLSEAPGAVDHFDGGYVTYTPDQKCAALKPNRDLVEAHGAVSASVAIAMAEGALCCSNADVAVAVRVSPIRTRMTKGIPSVWSSSHAPRETKQPS